MKRVSSVLVLAAVAVVMMLAPLAWAADVQGKIKSVDASGRMVTLDNGAQIMIPPTLTVERQALQPGANVKASYDEKDGQKVATSFTVMPPATR
ncbi:MAG TPA: DUF1344 domain-containing protein [Candidatus Binatia bacterium]|nr:DUF1344 domain-containing protein [Candidatus Binatia bacterium]